jgi:predicted hydrocarbon binding protein
VHLHEEIVAVTARWSEPSIRRDPLRPYGAAGEERTLELLEEALKSSSSVLDCKVTEGPDGILVDSFHTGIETDNAERMMLFRWDGINHMYDEMARVFDSGSEVLLFYEGVSLGESNANEVLERMGKEVVIRNMPTVLRMLTATGWGNASIVDMTPSGAPVIRIEDCFECSSKQRVRHGCAFMRGVLAGSTKALLGSEVKCEETRCRFKGDDCCEFSLVLTSS